MYSAGRSLDGTCGRRYLRRMRGHHWMLYQGICSKSVYYTCSNSLGSTPGACKEILCKQIQNRKDRRDFSFYYLYRSTLFSCAYNSRTCDFPWIFFLCDHAWKTCPVCNYDACVLCTDLSAVFQSSYNAGGRKYNTAGYGQGSIRNFKRKINDNYITDSPYRD